MKKVSRENMMKLINEIRNIVKKEIELSKYLEVDCLEYKIEQNDLEVYCQGVSNGFLSEIFEAVIGYKVEVIGEVEELFACPCCGFRTLTELHDLNQGTGYDICPYCNWEDDGTSERSAESSVNGGTIEDYRNRIKKNFNKYYINKWFQE